MRRSPLLPLAAGTLALALALALGLALQPLPARAAGYAINDQGARGMSLALAATATLDGPETLFFNPAGLASLEGWHVAGGMTALRLDVSSTPAASGVTFDSMRDHFEIPHLYVARDLGSRRRGTASRWALGLSVNSPFGLATEWPLDYDGRFVSRVADLRTVQVAALAGVRLPRGWSLGFGPTFTRGEVRLVRDVDLSIFRRGHQAEADLTGDGGAMGFRLGARWQGASGWRFGVALHGRTSIEYSGEVDYTVVPLGAFSLDQAIERLFVDGPASTTLTLPMNAWVGVGRVRGPWSFEAGLTWTDWSVMDEVVVDLAPVEAGGYEFVTTQFLTPRWHDAWALRASCRRALGRKWHVAGGIAYDASPVPASTADPLLPDSDRVLLAFGITRTAGPLVVDVGLQGVLFESLDTKGTGNPFESAYDSSAFALGATLSYRK